MNNSKLILYRDFVYNTVSVFLTLIRIPFMWRPVKRLPQVLNREVIILGNGPSLDNFLKNHFDFLTGKDKWAVNHMVRSEWFEKVKPEKYLISAPELWLSDVDEDIQILKKQLFDLLADKTTWAMDFFIPVAAKNKDYWYEKLSKNKNIHIRYYNTMPVEGFKKFRNLLYDLRMGMPRPHNVIIPSLMNAILSGYKTIYLTGIDHDWIKYLHVADDNTVYVVQKHFYDTDEEVRPSVMKSFGKGQRKMHEILEKFTLAFKGYHEIRQYALHKKVKIYNITPGSFVDAFERMKL